MASTPFVSVVIPAYNAAATLGRSVDSLIAQDFSDWEALVVDDGSTDNTPVILEELSRMDPRVSSLSQRNQRQAVARNAGISEARGRYIAFLDSDDSALPTRFAQQVTFLEKNRDVVVLGGGQRNFDAISGIQLGTIFYPETHDILCRNIFRRCPFCTSTVMVRAEFFRRRRFDAGMPPCEDHDLWIRSYRDPGVSYHNLPEPLVNYSARRYIPWSHYRQMHRMYRRALQTEGRWPRDAWYAFRPLLAAVRFNPFYRGGR